MWTVACGAVSSVDRVDPLWMFSPVLETSRSSGSSTLSPESREVVLHQWLVWMLALEQPGEGAHPPAVLCTVEGTVKLVWLSAAFLGSSEREVGVRDDRVCRAVQRLQRVYLEQVRRESSQARAAGCPFEHPLVDTQPTKMKPGS